MAKCTSLWNKSSRRPQAAEIVQEQSEVTLAVPNATSWNYFFLAVGKVYSITVKKSEAVLNDICAKFALPPFRPNEVAFMAEYLTVMEAVAKALDTLQAEINCFMGVLLPTISSLRARVMSMKDSLKYAGSHSSCCAEWSHKAFCTV